MTGPTELRRWMQVLEENAKVRLPVVYHVTLTKNVPSIRKRGLQRLRTSNWVQAGSRERYGQGEIFAFENEQDAVKWAGRMDWEFNKGTGTGKVSVITVNAPDQVWEVDESDPLSQAGHRGRWLKSLMPVPASAIGEAKPVTTPMIRAAVDADRKRFSQSA